MSTYGHRCFGRWTHHDSARADATGGCSNRVSYDLCHSHYLLMLAPIHSAATYRPPSSIAIHNWQSILHVLGRHEVGHATSTVHVCLAACGTKVEVGLVQQQLDSLLPAAVESVELHLRSEGHLGAGTPFAVWAWRAAGRVRCIVGQT